MDMLRDRVTLPQMYLSLVKATVINSIYRDSPSVIDGRVPGEYEAQSLTMIGQRRLDNVHDLLERVLRQRIPGDFIETGVWRGGVTIFAAAFFKVSDPPQTSSS